MPNDFLDKPRDASFAVDTCGNLIQIAPQA
jgi:hypothetical protein